MRDHDDLPYIVIERHSGGFGSFVWGILMGAAAALLLAPRSGAETQEDIRRRVTRARTAAEDRFDTARTSVVRTRERIEDQLGAVRGRIDDVREKFEDRADRAREVVGDGKRAARSVRDEVERRIHHTRDNDLAAQPTSDTGTSGWAEPSNPPSNFGEARSDLTREPFDDPSDLV